MPEMKTLGGYEVVDAKAREDIKGLQDAIENIGVPEVDLTSYALKSEVPTKVSQLENDSKFITRVPDEYITETKLNAKGYLTQHQSLAGYATETFVTNKIAEAELSSKDDPIDLSGYATKDDIKNFITEVPAEYITETELNSKGYLTEHQDLSEYVKKSEIPEAKADSVIFLDVGSVSGDLAKPATEQQTSTVERLAAGEALCIYLKVSDIEFLPAYPIIYSETNVRLSTSDIANNYEGDISSSIYNFTKTNGTWSVIRTMDNKPALVTPDELATTLTSYATKTYVDEALGVIENGSY